MNIKYIIAAAGFAAFMSASELAQDAQQDIISVTAGNQDFETLVAAARAGGLVETLQGEGPFTAFAPTDAVFEALPTGTVEDLLKPETKEQLTAILTYHVVPGQVMSSDIAGNEHAADTVQGGKLDINATQGVMVEDAKVVTPDIQASNGVIHVIDKVLLPEGTM